MQKSSKTKINVVLILTVALVWTSVSVLAMVMQNSGPADVDCPNGPMFAELGSANGTVKGQAQYRQRGSNALMVRVRGAAASSVIDVSIDGTSVGSITVAKNGNGDLRLDTTTATINERSVITLATGGSTVATGTFACAAGRGRDDASPSPTATVSPTATGTPLPEDMTPTPTIAP